MPASTYRRFRGPLCVLLALVVLDLIVLATSATWERHSPDDYAEKVNGCRRQRHDLVFVGGSPVSEGIIPSVVAGANWSGQTLQSAYALGLPGGTTSEFFHAVKLACAQPPRVLVYGITASDLNDSRHEPHGPASLMSFGDTFDWAVSRPDSRGWVIRKYASARVSRAWSLWRYRHGIRMWATLQFDEYFPTTDSPVVREAKELRDYADELRNGNGYAPAAGFRHQRYDYVKSVNGALSPFNFLDKYKTGSHRTYIQKLVRWAADNGTALVFVDMPVTADLEAKYPAAFAEYRRVLADEEAQRGLTVIRAHRDVVGLTDAEFADTIHLNEYGARTFSHWLKARLDDLGRPATTDDHRVRAQAGGNRP